MESMESMKAKSGSLVGPGPLIATGGGSWFVIVYCNNFAMYSANARNSYVLFS